MAPLQPWIIYTYHLTHLSATGKVRFYYALKGRDGTSGILKAYPIDQLAKTALLVPKQHEKDLDAFFHLWKCTTTKREVYRHA